MNFESIVLNLKENLKKLEADISLEESIKIYTECQKYIEEANKILNEAEGKIQYLIETSNGVELKDFNE